MRAYKSQGFIPFALSAPYVSEVHQVFEMKKSLEIPGDLHEQFFRYGSLLACFLAHISPRYLKGSSDGFKTVSDFFGRGVFTPH